MISTSYMYENINVDQKKEKDQLLATQMKQQAFKYGVGLYNERVAKEQQQDEQQAEQEQQAEEEQIKDESNQQAEEEKQKQQMDLNKELLLQDDPEYQKNQKKLNIIKQKEKTESSKESQLMKQAEDEHTFNEIDKSLIELIGSDTF